MNTTDGVQGVPLARKTHYSARDSVEAGERRESAPAWDAGGVGPTVDTGIAVDCRERDGREGGKDNDDNGTPRKDGLGRQGSCTSERSLQQTRAKEVRSHGYSMRILELTPPACHVLSI